MAGTASLSQASPMVSASSVDSKPEKKTKNKTERVTVRLTGTLGEHIRELEEVTTASSPSDVVRRAIVVYHTLVNQKLAGNDPVILLKEDGHERTVPIFL